MHVWTHAQRGKTSGRRARCPPEATTPQGPPSMQAPGEAGAGVPWQQKLTEAVALPATRCHNTGRAPGQPGIQSVGSQCQSARLARARRRLRGACSACKRQFAVIRRPYCYTHVVLTGARQTGSHNGEPDPGRTTAPIPANALQRKETSNFTIQQTSLAPGIARQQLVLAAPMTGER